MSTTSIDTTPASTSAARPRPASRIASLWAVAEVRWAVASLALFGVAAASDLAGAPDWLGWALYGGCYVTGGWRSALSGARALGEKRLDVDLLMVVAALGAAAIGQVFDGGLLIVIFATSGALEALATRRTEESVRALLTLTPERASVLEEDGTEHAVDAADLGVGMVIVVRPGERVGADGVVVDGRSEVDQASITGEPLPAPKEVGDEVFAGTLNGGGALWVRVTRAAEDSVVARIVALVEEASATKARTQLFIERVEQHYSVGVVVATLAIFSVPLAFGADVTSALLRAMTFMIVASPCAIVLATMPPLLSAIANAGRRGVLVKSAVVMEKLGTTTRVAFDKTGTLTEGVPRLVEVFAVHDTDQLLTFAAAAERPSEHVVARSLVAAATERGYTLPAAEGFRATPGVGVTARVQRRLVEVGNPALLDDSDDPSGRWARERVRTCEEQGYTAVVVRIDGRVAGVLALADRPRPEGAEAVARLDRLTGGSSVLLTGDNPRAGAQLGEQVGIRDVRAELLPQDKVTEVERLQATPDSRALVVGDGVNDAPALAAAHLGVAMGHGGADLTLQTADVVMVRDDLNALPALIRLSRRARRVVVQNLVIAGTVIVVLVTWDLVGHLPLPLGVAGHEGSTILVALNGLRLLRPSA